MTHNLNHDRSAAVAHSAQYLPMHTCPRAVKVLLPGAGGVATIGQYDGKEQFWRGWHPLPSVPKMQEAMPSWQTSPPRSATGLPGACSPKKQQLFDRIF